MEKDKIISAYEQMLMTRISLECLNPNDVGKKDVTVAGFVFLFWINRNISLFFKGTNKKKQTKRSFEITH